MCVPAPLRQRLSQIIKGMQEYLNLKRMQFPRFNFLSNNTLLELLERSREPAQVWNMSPATTQLCLRHQPQSSAS